MHVDDREFSRDISGIILRNNSVGLARMKTV
nr:MAG TPA: hypothetical protein [Caudoviricetes sp.]